MEQPSAERRETTPLWLSHHQPEHYDRCVTIGRRHVCRRCLVLYPLAFAIAAVTAATDWWPDEMDPAVLILLPIPAVLEFCLEQLGRLSYRPWRQIATTVLLAIALGRGFARYLEQPGDLLFWGMVVGYGGLCLATSLWRILDESPR